MAFKRITLRGDTVCIIALSIDCVDRLMYGVVDIIKQKPFLIGVLSRYRISFADQVINLTEADQRNTTLI